MHHPFHFMPNHRIQNNLNDFTFVHKVKNGGGDSCGTSQQQQGADGCDENVVKFLTYSTRIL